MDTEILSITEQCLIMLYEYLKLSLGQPAIPQIQDPVLYLVLCSKLLF